MKEKKINLPKFNDIKAHSQFTVFSERVIQRDERKWR
jgi:hypothetical protein